MVHDHVPWYSHGILRQGLSNWCLGTGRGPQESASGSAEKFREKQCKKNI